MSAKAQDFTMMMVMLISMGLLAYWVTTLCFFKKEILEKYGRIEILPLGLVLIGMVTWSFWAIFRGADAVFLRAPIPAFEQLSVVEAIVNTKYIRCGRRGGRNCGSYYVYIDTPTAEETDARIGRRSAWPCTSRTSEWARKYEGKRAKVWYFNERIVQMTFDGKFDTSERERFDSNIFRSCKYEDSIQTDKEKYEAALQSVTTHVILFFCVVFLTTWLSKSVMKAKPGLKKRV